MDEPKIPSVAVNLPDIKAEEPELQGEDRQVGGIEKNYRETPKYKYWEELFLDKDNELGKDTFGNATKSAIVAYSLDPKTQYGTAGRIGHDNSQKHKDLWSKYLSKRGLTHGKMLDIAIQKMTESKKPDWWNILADRAGVMSKEALAIQNQTNILINVNMDSPEVKQVNEELKKIAYKVYDKAHE